ncbi:MAG: hypothetical protein ACOYN6_14770, partial [Ignavibacteria bacterium]
ENITVLNMRLKSIRRIIIAFLFVTTVGSLTLLSLNTLQTKPNDDINNKFTNVGNIQMTVTNYGTIGKGYCGTQPSCMYPAGSGIENLWLGGLWVGGVKDGQTYVTTGAVDVANPNKVEGFEFTNNPGSVITERSSLITSPFYDPKAVSHQDFVCEFLDTNMTGMVNHLPLGIKVILESYTYNLNFANSFVILNYKIVNIGYNGSINPIDSIYIGLWKDCVVRNLNITNGCNPGTSFFSKGATGFVDSLRMEYTYDNNGDPGFTDNYVGVKLLGASPRSASEPLKSHFTIWNYKGVDPIYFMPADDAQKYSKLKGFLAPGVVIDTNRINYLRLTPSNRVSLISYGPYKNTNGTPYTLRYQQDTLNAVFTVVVAKKNGTDPAKFDTEFQRQTLYKNAGWAQRSYDNGYKLPSPPDIPVTRAQVEDNKVTIWWSNNGENSVDPISGKRDFEGYRLYRTNTGADLTSNFNLESSLKLIGDFDSCCNAYSNNTGFKFVKYSETEPKIFAGDTNKYWYRYEFPNQLNGFQYIYALTAYDKGDPTQGLEELESSQLANVKRVIVGTTAKDNSNAEIGVYPNPYYGSAIWDGTGVQKEVLRKIYFYNLPSKCDISVWSLSGDLVIKMNHDASTYNGNNIKWFKTFSDGTQRFAGGEHAWDLITKDNQAIATGLYLFTVKDAATGDIKKGKFLIVK